MIQAQKLPADQALLLQTLGGRVMLGADVMKRLSLKSPEDLVRLVAPLVKMDLVQISGDLTANGAPFAAFSTRPSDLDYIRRSVLDSLP